MLELASATVQKKGNSLEVSHGDDSGLIVSFYMEAEHQGAESEKQGRPIYKDVPYIWIRFAGDRNREVRRRVDYKGRRNGVPDPNRWPQQWAAFENQQEEVHEGTPIEEWGPLSKSQAMMYKGINIFTVENLSAVPDSALGNLGHGAREMRDKAISWLRSSEGSAELLALRKKNQDLENDIEILKAQFADLKKPNKKSGKK